MYLDSPCATEEKRREVEGRRREGREGRGQEGRAGRKQREEEGGEKGKKEGFASILSELWCLLSGFLVQSIKTFLFNPGDR